MRMNEFRNLFESIGINWNAEDGFNLRLDETAIMLKDCEVAGFSLMAPPKTIELLCPEIKLRLKSEFYNRHDARAVGVHYLDHQIGYLPRQTANRLWGLLNQGFYFYATVKHVQREQDKRLFITIYQNVR